MFWVIYSSDIDECLYVSAKVCHTNASCINTNGSYNCTCLTGYSGNGKNCSDINECSNVSAKVKSHKCKWQHYELMVHTTARVSLDIQETERTAQTWTNVLMYQLV
ncbi:adhesion G protein-coupled receptor E2-like isoform X2 [Dendronephthya gigantea]|uniref:adhesion G protein-coupled receptor E2-like isoform X2 n=1 Tax=Dendronephthya gigantea TaxID=151771 RepID=UPI00106917B8|nr:adhesion G protein-coupled receptor E2-like isoform X2 [Dendronephthya gigantea]